MPVFTVPFEDFGGLDLVSATNETGSSPDLLNVELDRPGSLRSRDGYAKLTATAGATRYDSIFAIATGMVASSTKIAGTGADDATVGTVTWSNPGNITALDGFNATASLSPGTSSHYLKATNFGFAIPATATIVGVVVTSQHPAAALGLQGATAKLVKGGVISGNVRNASGGLLGSTAETFGGSSDLWNVSLTPTDVNAATFGAVATVTNSQSIALTPTVDAIQITVYYQPLANIAVAGASGSRLDVIATDGTVAATVATATDTQSTYVAFGSPATSATYIANSGTTVRKLVGTTFSTPAGMPKAKFVGLTSPSNRLVAANIATIPTGAASTASTSLVHFSDPGLPETWSPNNYVYLTPGDNEDIQGVVTWRTNVFVFKSTRFFVFYGESTDGTGNPVFNYRRVDGAGMVAPLGVAVSPAGVYFLDRRGVYFTSGGPPQQVSQQIAPLFRGGTRDIYTSGTINPSALGQSCMGWFNDRLYLGVALGSATTNDHTLVYDPSSQQWSLWDIPMGAIAASAQQPGRLFFTYAQGTFDIGQYAPNAYSDDAGAAISSRYRSPFVPLDWRGRTIRSGIHGVDKTVRESLLEGSGAVTYTLGTQWAESASLPTGRTVTMGVAPQIAMGRDRTAVRGRMFSWQITAAAPWQLETLAWNVHAYQGPGEQSETP
jgi:hypothetical protein